MAAATKDTNAYEIVAKLAVAVDLEFLLGLLVCRDTLEDRLAFSFGFEFLGLHFAENLCGLRLPWRL